MKLCDTCSIACISNPDIIRIAKWIPIKEPEQQDNITGCNKYIKGSVVDVSGLLTNQLSGEETIKQLEVIYK